MSSERFETEIGIGNTYGSLSAVEWGGRFYATLGDYDGLGEWEIPESLYRELVAYAALEAGKYPPRPFRKSEPFRARSGDEGKVVLDMEVRLK